MIPFPLGVFLGLISAAELSVLVAVAAESSQFSPPRLLLGVLPLPDDEAGVLGVLPDLPDSSWPDVEGVVGAPRAFLLLNTRLERSILAETLLFAGSMPLFRNISQACPSAK